MGPVSAFGFSVCGWVRFEALDWRGRGGWDWPGRGAKSFWRQVLIKMPGASSHRKTSGRKSQYAAITMNESHFVLTIPREEVAWMQGGINLQPAGHGPEREA